MANIYLTEKQLKSICRKMLQEERNTQEIKRLVNESLVGIGNEGKISVNSQQEAEQYFTNFVKKNERGNKLGISAFEERFEDELNHYDGNVTINVEVSTEAGYLDIKGVNVIGSDGDLYELPVQYASALEYMLYIDDEEYYSEYIANYNDFGDRVDDAYEDVRYDNV